MIYICIWIPVYRLMWDNWLTCSMVSSVFDSAHYVDMILDHGLISFMESCWGESNKIWKGWSLLMTF
jgi:hypothetical protein